MEGLLTNRLACLFPNYAVVVGETAYDYGGHRHRQHHVMAHKEGSINSIFVLFLEPASACPFEDVVGN